MKLTSADLYLLCIFSCFVPLSVSTPVGFISLIDAAILIFATVVAAGAMKGRVILRNGAAFAVATLCFLSFSISQLYSGVPSISTYMKNVEFFIAIPFACAASTIHFGTNLSVERVARIICYGGRLCCTNEVMDGVPFSPGGLIPRLQ